MEYIEANNEIYSFVLEKAKIAMDIGEWFGSSGKGFVKINFACLKSIVVTTLERIKNALI
ncbi:MAG: hypothetical protein ACOC5R_05740 [Elusimicrobiota bacterium]